MLRFALTAVATLAGALLSTTPALAAPGGYYSVVPAQAVARPALVTRSVAWTLRDGVYVAPRAAERDSILCELMAKSIGTLTSFTVAGKPFDDAALAKCNSKAK